MRMLKENIGFLYTRYKPSFYVKSYLIQFLGLFIIKSCNSYNELFEGGMLVVTIINIITYPFTRFFYFSCKEWLFRGKDIYINSIIGLFIYYLCKFFMFSFLWVFSWLIGGLCVTYILLNGNAKKYLENKRLREEYEDLL